MHPCRPRAGEARAQEAAAATGWALVADDAAGAEGELDSVAAAGAAEPEDPASEGLEESEELAAVEAPEVWESVE